MRKIKIYFIGLFILFLFGALIAHADDDLQQSRRAISDLLQKDPRQIIDLSLYTTDANPLSYVGETAPEVLDLILKGAKIHPAQPFVRKSLTGADKTPIFYHAYIPRDRKKIKGIIITAYGASYRLRLTAQGQAIQSNWIYPAVDYGYAVFALNIRGTTDYQIKDDQTLEFRPHYKKGDFVFKLASRNAAGVNSMVRDIAYVGASIKEGSLLPDLKLAGRPVFFLGQSFGGLLATKIATEDDREVVKSESGKIQSINQVFDGIIAHAPYTDVKLDMESLTHAGESRFKGRDASARLFNPDWMADAFGVTGNLLDSKTNESISSLGKTKNIKRPVLLSHGLKDDNVSPRASLQFYANALTNNKGHFLSFVFDRESDHYWNGKNDNGETQSPHAAYNFLKTTLYFLDNVRLGTRNYFSPDDEDLKDTAWFVFRAVHPVIGRSYLKFAYEFLNYRQRFPEQSLRVEDYLQRYFVKFVAHNPENRILLASALGNLFSIYLYKTNIAFRDSFLDAVFAFEKSQGRDVTDRSALEKKLFESLGDSRYIDLLDVDTKRIVEKNTKEIQDIFAAQPVYTASLPDFVRSVEQMCNAYDSSKHGTYSVVTDKCKNYILYGGNISYTISQITDTYLVKRLIQEAIRRNEIHTELFSPTFISNTLRF